MLVVTSNSFEHFQYLDLFLSQPFIIAFVLWNGNDFSVCHKNLIPNLQNLCHLLLSSFIQTTNYLRDTATIFFFFFCFKYSIIQWCYQSWKHHTRYLVTRKKVLKKTQKHNKKVLELFLETSTFLENVTKKLWKFTIFAVEHKIYWIIVRNMGSIVHFCCKQTMKK